MNGSRTEPMPVPVRKYRYSKWRWRVLVHVLDAVGGLLAGCWRLARPTRRAGTPGRILVVQLDHLGDAVLSSPMFPALRKAYPEAAIDVLASPSGRAVFEGRPEVRQVIVAERNWFERSPGGWSCLSSVWALGWRLREGGYELGIDVRGDVLTVLVLALAGIPRRLGWAMGGGGFLLTDVAAWKPGRHEVLSRLALVEMLGIQAGRPERADVRVTDRDRERVARGLASAWASEAARRRPERKVRQVRVRELVSGTRSSGGGWPAGRTIKPADGGERPFDSVPVLAVHLGAGTSAKRWPLGHWQRLIDRFLAEGWRVVMVGGADDEELSRTVLPHPGLLDWTGRLTVAETTALIERADLFLGVDSGPAHLAAAAGTASVVLFSGTNRVRQWRPWSRKTLVLRARVPCRPCHCKVCPLQDHPCMTGMDPERVFSAAWRWWARTQSYSPPGVR